MLTVLLAQFNEFNDDIFLLFPFHDTFCSGFLSAFCVSDLPQESRLKKWLGSARITLLVGDINPEKKKKFANRDHTLWNVKQEMKLESI